jgi:GntR family transcriptional regulator
MRRFLQVAEAIQARITSGRYPVGKRLPGTAKLAEEFQCSASTVGQALAKLAAEGVVDILADSGTWPTAGGALGRFPIRVATIRRNERGLLLGAGGGDWPPLLDPEVVRLPIPADLAAVLTSPADPVDKGDLVVTRRRVVGTGYAVQSTCTYLAPWLVAALPVVAEADTGPGGWIERVEHDLQPRGPVSVAARFIARPATAVEVDAFDMPAQAWVVEGRRVFTTSAAMRPVSYQELGRVAAVEVSVWDARRVELVADMMRDTTATWPYPAPASMRNSPDP